MVIMIQDTRRISSLPLRILRSKRSLVNSKHRRPPPVRPPPHIQLSQLHPIQHAHIHGTDVHVMSQLPLCILLIHWHALSIKHRVTRSSEHMASTYLAESCGQAIPCRSCVGEVTPAANVYVRGGGICVDTCRRWQESALQV